MTFTGFENLTGGSGADIFEFHGTASVPGDLNGGLGQDTLDYSNYANGVVVNFSAGTATGVGGRVSGVEGVISNGLGVTLFGDENDNTLIGGDGPDTIYGLGGNDTLIGNGGDDLLDGGTGSDTADYHTSLGGVTVDLSAGTAAGHGSDTLVSIENATGSDFNDTLLGNDEANTLTGGEGNDTLTGLGGDDTYKFGDNAGTDTVTELVAGGTDTLDFSTAGTGAATVDLLFLLGSVTVTGTGINVTHADGNIENIIGGSGEDTLDFQADTTGQDVTLTRLGSIDGFAGTVSGLLNGTFDNINTILAGSGNDTLTGLNATSNWILDTGYLQYVSTNTLTFSEFEAITGGSGADTFSLSGAATIDLDGGAGDDTLSVAGYASGRDFTLTGPGVSGGFNGTVTGLTGTFSNIDNLNGSAFADTLTGLDADSVWQITGFHAGQYQSGNTLNFNSIETLYGGAGDDTLDYSAYTTPVSVDLSVGLATDVGAYSSMRHIVGGSGNDTLTGDGQDNHITGGAGNDTLAGGNGNDTYFFGDNAGTDTVIENAAEGTDELDFSTVTVDLTALIGSLHITGAGIDVTHADTNVENLVGGTGHDTLSYAGDAGAHTVTLTGLGNLDGFSGTATGLGGSFDNMDAFLGGSGDDTLIGLNSGQWTVDSYASGGHDLTFQAVETLVGGSGNDTLTFAGFAAARDIEIDTVGAVDGFDITESHFAGIFQNINTLIGSSAVDDTLTGLDAAADWTIQNSQFTIYHLQFSLDFTAIENLVGGMGADTFTIGDGATFDGSVDGQGGDDTLDYSAHTTAVDVTLTGLGSMDGFAGTGTGLGGTFDNINTLIGSPSTGSGTGLGTGVGTGSGTGGDTLTGPNTATTWTISNPQYLISNILAFTAFETLTGGNGIDTFNIAGAQTFDLHGGAGDDLFVFANGAVLNGAINGGVPAYPLAAGQVGDTLDYSAYTTDIDVNLAVGTATGTNGISSIENIIGGTSANTITGDAGDNLLVGGPSDDIFIGGPGDDTYLFTDGWGNDIVIENPGEGYDTIDFSGVILNGPLTIALNGGITVIDTGGNSVVHNGQNVEKVVGSAALDDVLDLSGYGAAVNVTLTGLGTADGFAGIVHPAAVTFDNVNELLGSAGNDSLTGMNATASWMLNAGTSQYVSGGRVLDFADFENITGGAGADTLDYGAYTTPVTVNLSTGEIPNLAGIATEIENITGGSANDILTGDGGPNILNGGPGNDILLGLGGNDTYVFDDGWGTDTITELVGEGYDTLDFSGVTADLTVTLASITVTDGVNTVTHAGTGIDNFISGSGNDIFHINTDQDIDLSGSAGDDIFNFADGATLTGTINGGSDTDTLNFSDYATGKNVTLTSLGNEDGFAGTGSGIIGDFTNINTIIGSATAKDDTLTGMNADAIWDIDGTNTYTVNPTLSFANFETLIGGASTDIFNISGTQTHDLLGGAGDDQFIFADNAQLVGSIDGGPSTSSGQGDTVDFSAYTTARVIVLTAMGSENGFAGRDETPTPAITGDFDNINTLIGSSDASGDDTLVGLDQDGAWVLIGDTYTYQTNPTLEFTSFENLVGGAGEDRFTLNGVHEVTLISGAGDDVFELLNGAIVMGSINGQGGYDTLAYDLLTLPPHDANAGTATGVQKGIYSIENFILMDQQQPAVGGEAKAELIFIRIIPVLSGDMAALDALIPTILVLLDEEAYAHRHQIRLMSIWPYPQASMGDQVYFPAGIGDLARLERETQETLPGGWEGSGALVSAMTVSVFAGREALSRVPAGERMLVSFLIPQEFFGREFVILYWDEGQGEWVEAPTTLLYWDTRVDSWVKGETLTEDDMGHVSDGRALTSMTLMGTYMIVVVP